MTTATIKLPKRKLHLNWHPEQKRWYVKKAFGFYPAADGYFSVDELREYLAANPDVDVVLRYF